MPCAISLARLALVDCRPRGETLFVCTRSLQSKVNHRVMVVGTRAGSQVSWGRTFTPALVEGFEHQIET
jgi:hypothetical protein